MNVLLTKFPTKIRVGEFVYDINSDFRNCLRIILAFEDDELTIQEKNIILLKRLYGENVPDDLDQALTKAVKFLDCGENITPNSLTDKRVYSFDKDAKYIFTAISQTHDVDLESIGYMHWWKFVFYFMDIDKDCVLSQFISLRQRKNEGKLTKEEKKVWSSMREILDLDFVYEESEEESKFLNMWNGGG